ncbi:hypothetical protein [Streptomyces sp. NPDC050535]|uniref:hypothetical protein n=1 Tax=Streptomyces sp. NPDC050535 TaxID=3365626 RepID=UPI0037ACE165
MDVSSFGAHGHVPLRGALLLAAVAGILLTALAGSAQITQLRAAVRKHRRPTTGLGRPRTRRRPGGSPDYREPATGCGL